MHCIVVVANRISVALRGKDVGFVIPAHHILTWLVHGGWWESAMWGTGVTQLLDVERKVCLEDVWSS